MKKHIPTISYNGLLGLVLYVLFLLVGEMPAMQISIGSEWGTVLFIFLHLAGCALVLFALLYKMPQSKQMIFRSLIFWISFVICLLLGGALRILPKIEQSLQLNTTSATENVSGLISFFFLVLILIVTVSTIAVRSIKNHNRTEDIA